MAGSFKLSDSLDNARSMDVTIPTGGVTKAELLAIDTNLYGFVFDSQSDASINSTEDSTYTFVYQANKVTAGKDAAAIDQGADVYWNGTAATASSTGNTLIGVCVEAATASASTVLMDFDGTRNRLV